MKIQEDVYWYREKGLMDANTYIIKDEITVLIDPGLETYVGELLKEMKEDGIDVKNVGVILITHLHPDHYGATSTLKEASEGRAKVAIHPLQMKYLDAVINGVSRFFGFGGRGVKKFEPDFFLGDNLSIGSTGLRILHTPGHSPESLCFFATNKKILISGDLVFDKSVGRTDIPGGSGEELKNSINMVSTLDTELLLPGHMGIVKGKKDVERNYEFIRGSFFGWL